MSVALVQGPVSNKNQSGSGPVSASFSSGVSASNVLVAVLGGQGTTGAFSGVSGAGATWTQVGAVYTSAQGLAAEIWVGTSPTASSTGPVTATAPTNPDSITITIYEVSGLTSTSVTNGPLTSGTTTGATKTGPSLTTYGGGLVIAAQSNNGGSITVSSYSDTPAGWVGETFQNSLYVCSAAGLYAPSTGGSAQQSVTYSSSFAANAVIVEVGGTAGATSSAPAPLLTAAPAFH